LFLKGGVKYPSKKERERYRNSLSFCSIHRRCPDQICIWFCGEFQTRFAFTIFAKSNRQTTGQSHFSSLPDQKDGKVILWVSWFILQETRYHFCENQRTVWFMIIAKTSRRDWSFFYLLFF